MKLLLSIARKHRVIAIFGSAQLRQDVRGRYQLSGGSNWDHAAAKEWISLFLHEAVLEVNAPAEPGAPLKATPAFDPCRNS